jgi:hypothetical protein
MALTDTTMPPAIKRLSRAANILLIFLFTIAIIDYSTVFKQLKDTITNYKVISRQMIRMGELLKVGYNVRSLVLLNQGVLANYQGFSTRQELFSHLKQGLQDSLDELYLIQNEINLSPLSLSEPHRKLQEEKSVNLFFRQDPTLGTTLIAIHEIPSMPLNEVPEILIERGHVANPVHHLHLGEYALVRFFGGGLKWRWL